LAKTARTPSIIRSIVVAQGREHVALIQRHHRRGERPGMDLERAAAIDDFAQPMGHHGLQSLAW
jgi:hypothetical protein